MTIAQSSDPVWRLYERIVAAVETEHAGFDMSVTPNAVIVGCLSGVQRQVDVLIDARWDDDISRRIIVDAKMHRAKLDVRDVESFEAMMRDCQAERGVLVCTNGLTPGAQQRAQDAITIKILTLDEAYQYSWAAFDECLGRCYELGRKSKRRGLTLWDAQLVLPVENLLAVVWSGKCDVCHNFHVWCWDCGEKFALTDEDEHVCGCLSRWVTAVQEEEGPG